MAEFVSVGQILQDNFDKWFPQIEPVVEEIEEDAVEVAQQLFAAESVREQFPEVVQP